MRSALLGALAWRLPPTLALGGLGGSLGFAPALPVPGPGKDPPGRAMPPADKRDSARDAPGPRRRRKWPRRCPYLGSFACGPPCPLCRGLAWFGSDEVATQLCCIVNGRPLFIWVFLFFCRWILARVVLHVVLQSAADLCCSLCCNLLEGAAARAAQI